MRGGAGRGGPWWGVNPLPPPGLTAEGGPGGLLAAQKALCTADGAKSLLLPLLHLRGSRVGWGAVCRAPALGVLSPSLDLLPTSSFPESLELSSQGQRQQWVEVQEVRGQALLSGLSRGLPRDGVLRQCFSDLRSPKKILLRGIILRNWQKSQIGLHVYLSIVIHEHFKKLDFI